jgi:hypothetical protein
MVAGALFIERSKKKKNQKKGKKLKEEFKKIKSRTFPWQEEPSCWRQQWQSQRTLDHLPVSLRTLQSSHWTWARVVHSGSLEREQLSWLPCEYHDWMWESPRDEQEKGEEEELTLLLAKEKEEEGEEEREEGEEEGTLRTSPF